jgi:hypothetical protein
VPTRDPAVGYSYASAPDLATHAPSLMARLASRCCASTAGRHFSTARFTELRVMMVSGIGSFETNSLSAGSPASPPCCRIQARDWRRHRVVLPGPAALG